MAVHAQRVEGDQTSAIGWRMVGAVPVPALVGFSAIFHYLGPALAVLLFGQVGVLGVAWLRIASAAAVFVVWRRPWRMIRCQSWPQRRVLLQLGVGSARR